MRPRLKRLAGDRAGDDRQEVRERQPRNGLAKAHAIEQQKLLELAFARLR